MLMLKAGKEKSVLQGHPWIFSGAVQSVKDAPEAGSAVSVTDHKGRFLARAYYNPASSIVARVYSRQEGAELDEATLRARISAAFARRSHLLDASSTMVRVVASEADLLPGLIVDRYGDWVVFQILTLGMEVRRDAIVRAIDAVFSPLGLIERSDEAIRSKEGMAQRKEILRGPWPEGGIEGLENGLRYRLDLWEGHKTGFYLDQRQNRALVARYAAGRDVLNCFAYTGGFSCAAGAGGARSVVSVDESRPALELAQQNWALNVSGEGQHQTVRADVFAYLRQLRAEGRQFDMIVMDPPKFVSDKHHLDRACRGYKDLNLLAFQLLRPQGLLATFSCSGLLSRDLFQKVMFGAALDAGCEAQVMHHLSQAEDHPLLLTFPESLYLKGLFCRRVEA